MKNIPERIQKLGTESNTKHKPGYYYKKNGTYEPVSFGTYYENCLAFAKTDVLEAVVVVITVVAVIDSLYPGLKILSVDFLLVIDVSIKDESTNKCETEPARVGTFVGVSVGAPVGAAEGKEVGSVDGCPVGLYVKVVAISAIYPSVFKYKCIYCQSDHFSSVS